MSMNLKPQDLLLIEEYLSHERLSPLLAQVKKPAQAIEIHQDILRLGNNLMTSIATIELALRNTVFDCLSAHFGTQQWITHPPTPFQWRPAENRRAINAMSSARRSSYAALSQAGKRALDAKAFPSGRPANLGHSAKAKHRQKQISVSNGKIVAEMTFFFWKKLYSADYEQTLWRPALKRTFPNKHITRAQVAENLEHIYQSRNRLAHHEAVLHKRFRDTVRALEFVGENLCSSKSDPLSPLAKLISGDLSHAKQLESQISTKLDFYRRDPV